jgi:hypothetical protein
MIDQPVVEQYVVKKSTSLFEFSVIPRSKAPCMAALMNSDQQQAVRPCHNRLAAHCMHGMHFNMVFDKRRLTASLGPDLSLRGARVESWEQTRTVPWTSYRAKVARQMANNLQLPSLRLSKIDCSAFSAIGRCLKHVRCVPQQQQHNLGRCGQSRASAGRLELLKKL